MQKKKLALVLSGGGFKGAFQVGALQCIKDHWHLLNPNRDKLEFDIVAGVSVGSLNGLLVAQNNFSALKNLWKEVANKGVEEIYNSILIDTTHEPNNLNPKLKLHLDKNVLKKLLPNASKNLISRFIFNRKKIFSELKKDFLNFQSIADNSPLRDKLHQLTNRDAIKDTIFKCGFVSLNDGMYYSYKSTDFKTNEDFANAVLASSAMPIVWGPIESIETKFDTITKDHKNNVDGGIRDVSPLGDVIHEIVRQDASDQYNIIIINCASGDLKEEKFENKNIASIALRSLVDIAINEIFNNDIKEFTDKNYLLGQILENYPDFTLFDYDYENNRKGRPLRLFESIAISPDNNTLGDSLVSSTALFNKRYHHGYEKAKTALYKHAEGGNGDSDLFKFTIV